MDLTRQDWYRWPRRLASVVALAALMLAGGTASGQTPAPAPAANQARPAQAQPAPTQPADPEIGKRQAELDAIKAELDQIEQSLRNTGLDEAGLQGLRDRLEPAAQQLAAFIAAMTPHVEDLNKRVAQLTPKGEAAKSDAAKGDAKQAPAPSEANDVTRLHDTLTAERDAAVGLLNAAQSLQVQATQLSTRIADRRRARLAQRILEVSPSIASPTLWEQVGAAMPSTGAALWQTATSWVSGLSGRLRDGNGAALAVALGLAILVGWPGRRFVCRLIRRAGSRKRSALGVALDAAGVAAAGVAMPLIAATLLSSAIDGFDLFPPRLLPLAKALIFAPAWVLAGRSIVIALLAPDAAPLRLITVGDAGALAALRLVSAALAVMTLASVLEAAMQSVVAPFAVSIAIKGIAALILAGLLIGVLWRASRAGQEAQDACLGPYVDPGGRIVTIARILGWIAAIALAATALAGYVALAWFLAQQLLWAAALFSIVTIAIAVIDALAGQMRRNDTAVARFAHLQVGLPQRALEQAGVLVGGGLKAITIVVAVILLLAPWGVESGSLLEAMQGVIFGFSVGGVSVSISSMVAAAALFAAAVVVTRAVQRWLEADFLPTTGMDAGLRNSIRTGVGYLGSLVAVAIGLSALGLSLDRLAIVAGALSVGIGFGLQSIVNNFVSGLILLWERPIRVGDWVVVGSDEGIVRRIHVRATEIETFDRSAVIIPNSTFISGVVKNKVLSDRSGRVALKVSVAPGEDPQKAHGVLTSCMTMHPDILKEPKPVVQLSDFGPQGIEFSLFGFVADVGSTGRIGSELRFAFLKGFREADIAQPTASSTLTLDAQQLEDALGQFARAVNEARLPAAEPRGTPKRAGERG